MTAKHLQNWARAGIVATAIALTPVAAWPQGTQPAQPTQPTQPAQPAQPARPTQPATPQTPEQEARSLAIGNSLHVVYHLVAQALIEQLALQPPDSGETGVHELATVLMIAASDDPQEDPALLSAMRGIYRASSYAERAGTRLPFWADHALDRSRTQWIVCTFYASEPDDYRALADEIGLAEDQRRHCSDEFAHLITVWAPILRPHVSDTGDTRPGRAAARVAWSSAPAPDMVRALRESRAIEQVAEDMTIGLRLPSDLVISIEPCGQPGAEWIAQRHVVRLCNELVEAFGQMMTAEVRDRPRP
jgi:hypothetical protein